MRDYRDEDHMAEWAMQAVDDAEYMERQQMLSSEDCLTCRYRSTIGECVNWASVYSGEEVGRNDVCEEWEGYEED